MTDATRKIVETEVRRAIEALLLSLNKADHFADFDDAVETMKVVADTAAAMAKEAVRG